MSNPKFKDEDCVAVEAMGFSWRLPWKTVKKDVESGLAQLVNGGKG
jgi:hypothetical protein